MTVRHYINVLASRFKYEIHSPDEKATIPEIVNAGFLTLTSLDAHFLHYIH